MATSLELNFDSWLSTKLKSLDTDESVFGSYITGILTGDESLEEKLEALEGIMSEIIGHDINVHCREIMDKWDESQKAAPAETKAPAEDVEEKLVRLMETNVLATTEKKEYTDEERKIREAILSQYGDVALSEQDCEYEAEQGASEQENNLVKNTNASTVVQALKEKREQAKIDSQKKKDKDREDRERQKQQQADKKEKRKTQKGERRR